MLEQGNSAVFTQGVRNQRLCYFTTTHSFHCTHLPRHADHHGDAAGEADAGRHRGPTRGHHQTGELDPGTARHVHGHGNAGGEPGENHTVCQPIAVAAISIQCVCWPSGRDDRSH